MATTRKRSKSAPVEVDPNAPPPPPRTEAQDSLALRRKVRLFYDIQEMRLSAGGRLLKKSPTNPIELHPDDLARLQGRVAELEVAEKHALKDVADHLDTIGFYRDVFKADRVQWRGIGPTMAGVILSSFDIAREDTPSKMWAFAGLAPIAAYRCKTCHNVVDGDQPPFKHPKPQGCKCVLAGGVVELASDVYASGKAARPVAGQKLNYNKWLRAKLCGVLGAVLLKLGSPYKKLYDDYKNRKASAGWGKSDAHRHAAAIRYMIKMMLLDIWRLWRTQLGLPVRPSYQEQYLGHTHGSGLLSSGPYVKPVKPAKTEPKATNGNVAPVSLPPLDPDALRDAQIEAALAEGSA